MKDKIIDRKKESQLNNQKLKDIDLSKVQSKNANEAFVCERVVLPIYLENKLKNVEFSQRDVLVGVVKDIKQLAANLTHRFYHTPKKSLANKRFPIDTIALYQSIRGFGKEQSGIWYYGKVIRYEILKRENITEIFSKRNPDELYYKFVVKEWIQLPKRIKPKEIAPVINTYTNLYLLENSNFIPELYIRSEEEYCLFYALKQLLIQENNSQAQGFIFGDNKVVVKDENIYLFTKDRREQMFEIIEFIKRPREVIKKMMIEI